jgi:hypothetical protein
MKEYLDKIKTIESISNFDRAAIDLLIEYSHDRNLIVRYHAYCKLNSDALAPQNLSKRDWELLSRGVLLNPGDLVWSVYQSGLVYTDDAFIIFDLTDDSGKESYGREIDSTHYDLWNITIDCKTVQIEF